MSYLLAGFSQGRPKARLYYFKLGRKGNFGMATPNQEVVLRLDEETMERLVVGVADYLRNTQRGQPGTSTVPLRYNVALARDIFLDSRSHHARLVSSVQACYQKVALRFVYN